MKILIVDSHTEYRGFLVGKLVKAGYTVKGVDQEDALAIFLDFEPDTTLVLEYYEEKVRVTLKGREMYHDLKNSTTEGQRVFRAGILSLDYDNYLSAKSAENLLESFQERIV